MFNFLRSKKFHSTLGACVSVAIIIWMCLALDWGEVVNEMKTANYWVFLPTTILLFIHFYLRGIRYYFLLPSDNELTYKKGFDSVMMGNFINFVLPLRAGEFVRPYVIVKSTNIRYARAFAGVVIERFFDLSVVLFSFSLMLFFVEGIPDFVMKGAALLGVLAFVLLCALVVGAIYPEFSKKIFDYFTGWLPAVVKTPLAKFFTEFLDGAKALGNFSNLIRVIILSLLVWFTAYALFYLYFDLSENIQGTPWMAVSVGVVLALGVAAPSAPGYIGVYQAACIAGFALFGVGQEHAASYSIICHAHQYLIYIVYGLYLLMSYNLRFSELRTVQAEH